MNTNEVRNITGEAIGPVDSSAERVIDLSGSAIAAIWRGQKQLRHRLTESPGVAQSKPPLWTSSVSHRGRLSKAASRWIDHGRSRPLPPRHEGNMDALPSLPRVLVGILDVLQDDAPDLRKLSDTILQDIGLTTRVIAAASSIPDKPRRGFESLEQAMRTLGLPTVKALMIKAAIQQLFEQFSPRRQRFLNRLWRRALTTASLGKALAVLTGYRRPEEAYLAGLLADLGRLVHLTAVESEYDRLLTEPADDDDSRHFNSVTAAFGPDQVEAAVALLEGWGLDPFIIDAVRYHLEPVHRIRDAHHLAKLVNLAYAMARSEVVSDPVLTSADLLFGLDEGLTRELHRHAGEEVARLATALQIDSRGDASEVQSDNDRHRLAERLQDLAQLEQLRAELAQVTSPQVAHAAVQRAVFLALGVEKSLLFLIDPDAAYLRAWTEDDAEPTFVLRLEEGRSLVTDALLNHRMVQARAPERGGLSVIDQQIFGLCSAEALWIQPLARREKDFGVLVLGLAPGQLSRMRERAAFVQTLGTQIVRALTEHETQMGFAETANLKQNVREMVHEASNPLGIIQNYLATLRIKLGEHHDAHYEIGVIREEIERVGRILMRMGEHPQDSGHGSASLNDLVRRVTDMFAASVGVARNLAIEVELSPADPPANHSPDHIRQILTNLLRNAAQALDSGGRIRVATSDPVSVSGRSYTELVIEDNGPGLPREIMDGLFMPVESTKGSAHQGLGLSIVKRLTDEMGASILCSSSPAGTRFQLLLPCSSASTAQAA